MNKLMILFWGLILIPQAICLAVDYSCSADKYFYLNNENLPKETSGMATKIRQNQENRLEYGEFANKLDEGLNVSHPSEYVFHLAAGLKIGKDDPYLYNRVLELITKGTRNTTIDGMRVGHAFGNTPEKTSLMYLFASVAIFDVEDNKDKPKAMELLKKALGRNNDVDNYHLELFSEHFLNKSFSRNQSICNTFKHCAYTRYKKALKNKIRTEYENAFLLYKIALCFGSINSNQSNVIKAIGENHSRLTGKNTLKQSVESLLSTVKIEVLNDTTSFNTKIGTDAYKNVLVGAMYKRFWLSSKEHSYDNQFSTFLKYEDEELVRVSKKGFSSSEGKIVERKHPDGFTYALVYNKEKRIITAVITTK